MNGGKTQLLFNYFIKGEIEKCSIDKGIEKQTDNFKELNVGYYMESTDLSMVHLFGEDI